MLSYPRFFSIFAIAFWFLVAPATAQMIERHALVIANSDYISDKLDAAAVDGKEIQKVLADSKFKTRELLQNVPTKEAFFAHWEAFLAELKSGVAVFYFTGHGAELDGDSILLPTGIRPDEASDVRLHQEGISLKQLFNSFKKRQQELKGATQPLRGIFIIDACRTRPKIERTITKNASPVNGKPSAVPITPPPGIFVYYATSAHQVAHTKLGSKDPVLMSVYTRTLLEQFKKPAKGCDQVNGCSLQTLARLVRWQVHVDVDLAYGGEQPQTPVYFDDIPLQEGRAITMLGADVADNESFTPARSNAGPIRREPGSEIWECEDCPHLIVVPPGKFRMGDAGTEERLPRPIEVKIAQPFAIGISDVTVAQFRAYLVATHGSCPKSHHACASQKSEYPVTGISWNEAQKYIEWLNAKPDLKIDPNPQTSKTGYYRLPAEAEWEYAARAKSTGRYTFGDDKQLLCKYGNGADQELHQLANANNSCSDGVGRRVAAVMSYKPNAFGLYDVHGNVWKWVADCWTPSHDPKDTAKASGGMASVSDANCARVAKGGSWLSDADALRLTNRISFTASHSRPTLGFRVVRELPKL